MQEGILLKLALIGSRTTWAEMRTERVVWYAVTSFRIFVANAILQSVVVAHHLHLNLQLVLQEETQKRQQQLGTGTAGKYRIKFQYVYINTM